MKRTVLAGATVVVILSLGAALPAQQARGREPRPAAKPVLDPGPALTSLTIDLIMKGEEFVGVAPSGPQWSMDGRLLYFQWRKPGAAAAELFAIGPGDAAPRPVKPEEYLRRPPAPAPAAERYGYGFGSAGDIQVDASGKRALVSQDGDLFLVELPSGKSRRLTDTDERETNARFSRDGGKVVFTSGDNVFLLSLADGGLRQATSFIRREPPPGRTPGEIEQWYAAQQRELFQELRQAPERPARARTLPNLAEGPRRRPFHVREDQRVFGELSPDEKTVVFTVSEPIAGTKDTIVPSYVTRSGYTETITSHPKAAEIGRIQKAGLMSVATGEVKWIDYGREGRAIQPGSPVWSPDGSTAVMIARSDDRKDQWLVRLDIETGTTSVLQAVHDDAWVGPLGLTNVFFWPDGRAVSFISEKDGYAHLYKAALDGSAVQALTSGPFEVTRAVLSRDGRTIYLASNEEHPGELHFYAMPAAGGPRARITSFPGRNEVTLSPDETTLAILRSSPNRPPELWLQANSARAEARPVTESTLPQFRSYPWYDPEIVRFAARDGVGIYARLFTPTRPHPARPAVIFIHGAGYLQNAHRGWSTYYREYMFHNFLMEHGYVVLDVDYRGSSGYGRDFRTGIYRHMGGKDLDDIVDAAGFLVEKIGVDAARIGCYGGSYGGFLTLMALFTSPDTFRAGAALRPVTDWAHYHAGYTADILNLPHQDPEAFGRSSPINFAAGLKGGLLICHGMVDTNVHFQDSVRLAQRLIELGKENWELRAYPVENHSFTTASAWTDEYKRIFALFEANLTK